MITLKNNEQLTKMRYAGKVAALTMTYLTPFVKPGVSTKELNYKADAFIRSQGCIPACINYKGYPFTLCTSINDEAVHCFPSNRVLNEGDILKIDFCTSYDGWHSDTAKTFLVGEVDPKIKQFVDTGYQALKIGLAQVKDGNFTSDIGNAVANFVAQAGYGLVKEYTGHGIGRAIHEEPQVPCCKFKDQGVELSSGMVICVEPILTLSPAAKILSKDWNTWTDDKSWVTHWEHCIALTDNGPEILTLREEEA